MLRLFPNLHLCRRKFYLIRVMQNYILYFCMQTFLSKQLHMKYKSINPELFRYNRKRFARQMKADSIAIFHSNDRMPRNGDQFHPFRQSSSLFRLCGIDQEETTLVLFPDCPKDDTKEILFVKRTTEKQALYEGQLLNKEQVRKLSGVQKICWLEDMEVLLHELILLSKRIYVNLNENEYFHSDVLTRDHRFAQQLMQRYPAHKYHRAQPLMKNVSMIKSPWEVELIQESIHITEKAFARVMKFIRPGVMEYEVEAEIIHEFIRNRANGHAYEPIVASGANACILHYGKNNQACKDGDLVLMDFGAEYANYAADLTRVVPVNGRFNDRQRDVYNAVLKVMRSATELLVPGILLDDYHQVVGKMMEQELMQLGLISRQDIKAQDPEHPAYKKYFMHGTSHHLGLDVHDLSNRYVPIQAGMVFTVEPAIYIPAENIGIRLENNILVTDEGPIDLMADIPVEIEAIEEIMNRVEVVV